MNSISIMGRMCADAELRTTQLGTPIVSCRVAVFRTKEQTDLSDYEGVGLDRDIPR